MSAQFKFSIDQLLKLVELYPKNYQVWRLISTVDDENIMELIEFAFSKDSKNYHAWEVLVGRPSIVQFGLQLSSRLLHEDKDNNSAKSYLTEFNNV